MKVYINWNIVYFEAKTRFFNIRCGCGTCNRISIVCTGICMYECYVTRAPGPNPPYWFSVLEFIRSALLIGPPGWTTRRRNTNSHGSRYEPIKAIFHMNKMIDRIIPFDYIYFLFKEEKEWKKYLPHLRIPNEISNACDVTIKVLSYIFFPSRQLGSYH